jgi:hypothetical protein
VAKPLRTYFTFSWFNRGNPSSIEQFKGTLAKYNRDAVVAVCSAVNCLLKTWGGGYLDPVVHDVLVNSAFPPSLANEMVRARKNPGDRRMVFHRQQLLFVAKMAVIHCATAGVNPLPQKYWGGLGDAFLMANDHLHFTLPTPTTPDQEVLNVLSQFIPALESSGLFSLRHMTARAHTFAEIASDSKSRHNFVNLPDIFESLTGLTVLDFHSLCFAVIAKYIQMDLRQFLADGKSFFLTREWFRTAALQPEKVDRFLSEMASSGHVFQASFKSRDTGASDFTPMRDKPIFVANNHWLFAIDTAFVADKIESGIFWRVHNSLKTREEKRNLHAFWADIFETYLDRLLSQSIDGIRNRFFTSPRYASDGNEVCDGLILCGTSAILLEYKGVTFTAESKYSGNPALVSRAIDEKLVSPKGVEQLANAVRRLFTRGTLEQIRDVDTSGVLKVFPVLVTRDPIGRTLVLNLYLHRKFQTMVNRRQCRPRIITPLFCMDADAIETISAYLKDVRLDHVLDAQHKADPNVVSTFQAINNSVLDSLAKRDNPFIARAFEDFFERGIRTLFPYENLDVKGAQPNLESPQS